MVWVIFGPLHRTAEGSQPGKGPSFSIRDGQNYSPIGVVGTRLLSNAPVGYNHYCGCAWKNAMLFLNH